MTTFSTKNNLKKIFTGLVIAAFWIGIWYIISIIMSNELLVPTPLSTLRVWCALAVTWEFWRDALFTLVRVFFGFVLGVFAGILGAFCSVHSRLFSLLVSPLLRIIRAAPVASFIILALVWFKTNHLPVFISLITVLPIVWLQTETAIRTIDSDLLEMARVMQVSRFKTLFRIKIPSIMPAVSAAAIASLGFGWKSAIAAEVICRPELSLGGRLQNAKIYLETPEVFAITFTIIILSILLESLFKRALERLKRGEKAK